MVLARPNELSVNIERSQPSPRPFAGWRTLCPAYRQVRAGPFTTFSGGRTPCAAVFRRANQTEHATMTGCPAMIRSRDPISSRTGRGLMERRGKTRRGVEEGRLWVGDE